ncbi:hypothetical protein EG329_003702 [Mollisiaceae sp. DMI_Dod_QoI]|nr:hypothetical protein EG329_003702 [Helotiales sp. DMI_Dod_QoI]
MEDPYYVDGDFIFDQDIVAWLRELRLVSKGFNDVITPLLYRTIDISSIERISKLVDIDYLPNIKDNIAHYTRYLRLPSSGEYTQAGLDIIKSCNQLKYIEWLSLSDLRGNFVSNSTSEFQQPDVAYLNTFLRAGGSIRNCLLTGGQQGIQVESLRTGETSLERLTEELAVRLPMHVLMTIIDGLSSAKPDADAEQSGITSPGIFEILLLSIRPPYLQTLQQSGLRLPAMRHLILDCPLGNARRPDIADYWDFSNIHSLTLLSSEDRMPFMLCFPHTRFSTLRALAITCNLDETAGAHLEDLFEGFTQLESLIIHADERDKYLPVSTIVKAGQTLRSLTLQGKSDIDQVSSIEMRELLHSCPNITKMMLEFSEQNLLGFLEVVPFFKQLCSLDLFTENEWGTFDDMDIIESLMIFLNAGKQGVKFDHIVVHVWNTDDTSNDDYMQTFGSRITNLGRYERWNPMCSHLNCYESYTPIDEDANSDHDSMEDEEEA